MYTVPSNEEIGASIRRRREARDIRQAHLAAACGVSRHRMCVIEKGRARPDYELLFAICNELRVSPARLLGL